MTKADAPNKNGMTQNGAKNGSHYHGKNNDRMDLPIGGISKKESELFMGNNFLTDLMVQGPNLDGNL